MKNNIDIITSNSLCTACGACSGICPTQAINMEHNAAGFIMAEVNNEKCIECNKCLNICPSNSSNSHKNDNTDFFHGTCLAGYIGYANDAHIRQISQSGGIVTTLLCYLLDKGLVDGAVVNNFDNETKRPKAVLATNREEVIDSAGSYYTQSSVVKTILDNQDKKLAAVTLGCQSESINFIKQKYSNINTPLYNIGLVCAGQNSGYMIDDILEKANCSYATDIYKFRFRDKEAGGWPGNITIKAKNGKYTLDKKYRHSIKSVYEAYRCILCYDQMNIYSDIVVGDPWGISNLSLKEGYSVIIARTDKGKKLLEDACRDNAIILEELSVDKIIKGQTVDNRHKTKFYTALDICKKNNWLFPYNEDDFSNIEYNRANVNEYKLLAERMKYTKKVNEEPDKNNAKKNV